ncbi:hypothetical protein F750_2282 [Streptomyces sp. PAMC 26508]|nr:hypothetical protein F750_2282 [Streptomyces sp. PAMC 26508]
MVSRACEAARAGSASRPGRSAGTAKGTSASAGVPQPAQASAPLRCRWQGWQ